MFKNILIPTDGSALSRKAIKAGVALARAIGARVTGFLPNSTKSWLMESTFLPSSSRVLNGTSGRKRRPPAFWP
jgi:nucleotide-binding universal stress UspA family protein